MNALPPVLNFGSGRRVPVILQTENTECALACLAMVAAAHGNREGLAALRHRIGVSTRGATLTALMDAAHALGMTSRPLRCEVTELRQLNLPAILHWDFAHFVVLTKVSRRDAVIHDPAVGVRRISLTEAGQHFTGVAIELAPGEEFAASRPAAAVPVTSYFRGIDGLMPALGQILLLSVLLQVAALATPFYMQLVVDEVLVKRDTDLLLLLAAGFLALALFSIATRALRGWIGIYLTNQLGFLIGARFFRHLLSLPAAFFARRHMGDILSRFGSLRPVQDFVTGSTVTVLLDGVMAVTTITLMCLYSAVLALVVIGAMLLYLVFQLALYGPMKRRQHEQIGAEARVESYFMESLRAIGAIKRYGIEASRSADWQNRFADAINARIRVGRLSLAVELMDSAVAGTSHVLVVFLGAREVLTGEMTIGMLYAFLAWRNHMTGAVTRLVNEYVRYLMLSLHLERLADIQLAPPEDPGPPARSGAATGRLEVRGAGFRHSDHDPWLFRGLTLSLAPGESLAIYGPSGCGKSSLMACLQGDLALTEGELLFDGEPLSSIGLATLRRATASVMQSDALITGTLQANIAFGEAVADFERVVDAARRALISDDIERWPMRYDTLVGEMQVALSAGQVQRLLIARALYRQPRILLLDEGTAHLDRETEARVMHNLLALDMSCVYVTHNRSLVAMADKVLLLGPDGHRLCRPRQKLAA